MKARVIVMSKKNKRARVEKVLMNKERCLNDREQTTRRYQFLDDFVLCEIVCKAVLALYKKNNKTYSSDKDLRLDMKEIPAALKYAGYNVDNDILSNIFAGSGNYRRRGTKSAKLLRNGIIHNLSETDVVEMCNRFEHLHNTMNAFLSHFRGSLQEQQNTQEGETINKAA